MSMNAIFDPQQFFDKIYCISVDTREDRRIQAKKEFDKLGIGDRVEFVLVKKHHKDPEQGIFESHFSCLRRGYEAGAEHILIFEDDLVVDYFQEERSTQAIAELAKLSRWDGFYLGAIVSSSKRCAKHLSSIRYRCLTHGYALNRPFVQQILKKSWQGVAYDGFLKEYCHHCFAPIPMIAFQSTAKSDNTTFQLDRIRRIFGGLKFLQRANELFLRYKYPVIASHILLLLLGLLLIVTW